MQQTAADTPGHITGKTSDRWKIYKIEKLMMREVGNNPKLWCKASIMVKPHILAFMLHQR